MNFRYPVFLDVADKRCLVTGEGYEVAAKVVALVEAGARVVYVNHSAVPEIAALPIEHHRRDFQESDLDNCFLVITCGPHNRRIFELAEARGILCNAVDDPKHCRYSYGSRYTQGDLTIAISTNGVAPALAVRLKEQFARNIGPEYGQLLALLKELRPHITKSIGDFGKRKALWYRIIDSDVLERLRQGDQEGVRTDVLRWISEQTSD